MTSRLHSDIGDDDHMINTVITRLSIRDHMINYKMIACKQIVSVHIPTYCKTKKRKREEKRNVIPQI